MTSSRETGSEISISRLRKNFDISAETLVETQFGVYKKGNRGRAPIILVELELSYRLAERRRTVRHGGKGFLAPAGCTPPPRIQQGSYKYGKRYSCDPGILQLNINPLLGVFAAGECQGIYREDEVRIGLDSLRALEQGGKHTKCK